MKMTRTLIATACSAVLALGACDKDKKDAPNTGDAKTRKEDARADKNSGADGKRSSAQVLKPNAPHTDEVSYANGDRTDWYAIELRGRNGVLTTQLNWDVESSDVMIDVFD